MDKKIDRGFGRKLRAEIEDWQTGGIISAIQKEQILALYRVKPMPEGSAGTGRLITTLSVLGSILAGIGVILFVAANWSGIPIREKLAIIFVPMAAAYGIGYYLRYERGDFPKVGASFILLGSLIFGAGIFLIAQIYHLSVHYPNGPLVWGLGVLPLAYLLRFKTLLSLSLVVLLAWLGLEAAYRLAEQPFSASGLPLQGPRLMTLYLLSGVALWGMGLMHRAGSKVRSISSPFIVLGVLAAFIPGFLLTFDLYGERLGSTSLGPFYAAIAVLFFLSLVGLGFSRDKETGWVWEIFFLTIILGIGLYLALFFPGTPGSAHKDLVLSANIIFALAIFIVLILGYLREYPAYVNIALLFFVLDVIVRYFDFFWKLLPRSLFFIIGGLTLLFGGILLERKRRKVLASFREEEE